MSVQGLAGGALSVLLLAACTQAPPAGVTVQRAPGRTCIDLAQVQSLRTVAADTLAYTLVGGVTYRSRIDQACPHLAELDRFYTIVYESSDGPRICAGDRFRVVDPAIARAGGVASFPACRFGRFVRSG